MKSIYTYLDLYDELQELTFQDTWKENFIDQSMVPKRSV